MKNLWSWLGIIVLVAILGWGGYYGWQQKDTIEGLRNQLTDQNNSTKNQTGNNLGNFALLNNQLNNTIGLNDNLSPTQKDTRILIVINNQGFYDVSGDIPGPSCSNDWNNESATTTSVYSNVTKGISVALPYNPNWGSSKYRVNPYDIGDTALSNAERIVFGKIAPFEGCSLVRAYSLEFLPAKSISQLTDELIAGSELSNQGVSTKQINGVQVIEYTVLGMCSDPTVVVIGQKYNYRFNYICNGSFSDLEAIAKTVKLL